VIQTLLVGEDLPNDVPTVVFLHGLFGQGRNFATIAKGLLPDARSVLVDLPNHGRSDWNEGVDLVDMADAVAAAVRERTRTPVALVGHSLGGKVAMLLALRHPELVDRLVVVDISPVPSRTVGQFEQLLDALATIDLETLGRRSDADAQLTELIPDGTVRAFLLQNLHRDGDRWAWRANLSVLRASLDVVGSFPETGDLRYPGPVLWVRGERSDYIGDVDTAAMRALFPRTVSVTVKDAGHWVHSEQPAAFGQVLRRFLLPAGPG
jgi:pimeloyl-ACP methyl ester carboxylesterase